LHIKDWGYKDGGRRVRTENGDAKQAAGGVKAKYAVVGVPLSLSLSLSLSLMALSLPRGVRLLNPQNKVRVSSNYLLPSSLQFPHFSKRNQKNLKLMNPITSTPRASSVENNGSPATSESPIAGDFSFANFASYLFLISGGFFSLQNNRKRHCKLTLKLSESSSSLCMFV